RSFDINESNENELERDAPIPVISTDQKDAPIPVMPTDQKVYTEPSAAPIDGEPVVIPPDGMMFFSSIESLMDQKKVVDNKGPLTKADCSLPPEEGLCRALFPKWHYSPSDKTCKSFDYGGCGGNRNKFETIEECLDACSQL
ncbi:unnamed protein product, partial [Oppiella nova]